MDDQFTRLRWVAGNESIDIMKWTFLDYHFLDGQFYCGIFDMCALFRHSYTTDIAYLIQKTTIRPT